MSATTPKVAKELGRKVKNFDPKIWDSNKLNIVSKGNYLKFTQNKELCGYLISTSNKMLIEASPYDKIWGVGLTASDPRILDTSKWRGENLLGKVLIIVREDIIYNNHNKYLNN